MRKQLLFMLLAAMWFSAGPVLAQISKEGTITASATSCTSAGGARVTLGLGDNSGSVTVTLSGTWAGTAEFKGTNDGNYFESISGYPLSSTTAATSATANGTWAFNVSALTQVCVYASAYTSGTITVQIRRSVAAAKSRGAGTGTVTGSGTANNLAKFTGATALGDALITDDGSTVTLPSGLLDLSNANMKPPTSAGCTPTVTNQFCQDSTTGNIDYWDLSTGAVESIPKLSGIPSIPGSSSILGTDGAGSLDAITTLAGLAAKVNLIPPTTAAQTGTYQVLAADFPADGCGFIPVTSGTFTMTLVASGSQPADGRCLTVLNYGTGVVTLARSGQNINGAAANLTGTAGSATAPTGWFCTSDGTNYICQVVGGGGGSYAYTLFTDEAGTLSTVNDNAAYYFGCNMAVDGTTGHLCIIPTTGTLTKVSVAFYTAGTSPTGESNTLYFRLAGADVVTVSSSIVIPACCNTTSWTTNSAISQAVTAGQTFEYKWLTPTFVTNPSVVHVYATLWITVP